MTVPHITKNHYEKAWSTFSTSALVPSAVTICNKAIEIAMAEQATQEPYITADEARALGVGNAEWRHVGGSWAVINSVHPWFEGCQYRAIRKEVPAEPMDLELARAMCRGAGISLVSRDFIERFTDFVSDWRKGDFTLPKYAELDMQSCFNAWQAFDPDLAIQAQPEPVEPTCQYCDGTGNVHGFNGKIKGACIACDANKVEPHAELKTLYAQQVKDGTLHDFIWEYKNTAMSNEWREVAHNLGVFRELNQYRCTPKPTCQVKNLDSGELKTMTREAAKKLQAETKDVCYWFSDGSDKPFCNIFSFDGFGIYTYKLKANLVKLDGKLMSREAAVEIYGQTVKGAFDLWFKPTNGDWAFCQPDFYYMQIRCYAKDGEYQLREKPKKQVSWKDIPVGVMTNKGVAVNYSGGIYCVQVYCKEDKNVEWYTAGSLELAPASEQPWLVRHGTNPVDIFAVKGIVVQSKYVNGDMFVFKVTGIAEDYELK